MIQQETILQVADNSGVKKVMCVKVLGGSKKRYATLGDEIIVAVKEAQPAYGLRDGQGKKVHNKAVQRAVVVRTKKKFVVQTELTFVSMTMLLPSLMTKGIQKEPGSSDLLPVNFAIKNT